MYDISGVVDATGAADIEPGTSLLIAGPAMTGKEALAHETLADGLRHGQGAVGVTTNGAAEDVVASLSARVDDLDAAMVGAIDCREGDDGGLAAGPGSSDDPDAAVAEAYRHHVGSPADLTGMGIGITRCFERFQDAGVDRGRLALASLSTMLTYTDRQTVFKFCHVLSSRLDNAGYLGVFTVDTSAHDEQTRQVLKQAFDGMIEIREEAGGREARLRGVRPDPSEWIGL